MGGLSSDGDIYLAGLVMGTWLAGQPLEPMKVSLGYFTSLQAQPVANMAPRKRATSKRVFIGKSP